MFLMARVLSVGKIRICGVKVLGTGTARAVIVSVRSLIHHWNLL